MFTDLNAHIVSSEPDSQGDFFLVTEACDSDGSFILHHFLTQYLKSSSKVVFLGLAQSFSHYNAVAQKLGVNLMAARTSGQLDFISGLQYSFPLMREEGSSVQSSSQDTILQDCIISKSLHPLYKQLQKYIGKETGTQTYDGTLLMIDDLSILHSLGVETSQIANFMQYCQQSGSIVSLLHCDGDEDEEMLSLSTQLQHACTCHLMIEGLPTGFSKDVHGQLTIRQKSSNVDNARPSKKMLQFKITDKNVSFFPAGTSSAVL
ncbi:elongator complex protein 6 [Strongylocentrotus purpuratus]|uniref:Elongator complex protein 6 n=1 Tax=Strongylocentrotus purpuratus TaxID=7668 RepID=A0A7M7N1C0_STRPU|nr:elongator complex protein 6 [Strongylocentrotus purpuratus]